MNRHHLTMALLGLLVVCPAASRANAQSFTLVFGPQRYERRAGGPQTFLNTFQHCAAGPCRIVVTNGDAQGNHRASAASISLNGRQIVASSEINPRVAQVVKSVDLTPENQLSVTLASGPGTFIEISLECDESAPILVAQGPGASPWDPSLLAVALTILNLSSSTAQDVHITSLHLAGGNLASPTMPTTLGTIAGHDASVLQAQFSGGPFLPDSVYALEATGTYVLGGATICFPISARVVVPPPSEGSVSVSSGTIAAKHVSGAPYPPQPAGFDEDEDFPHVAWTVPVGPSVPGPSQPPATNLMPIPQPAQPGETASPVVEFSANSSIGPYFAGTAEPSGASGGGVVFMTANPAFSGFYAAAYSTNGGATFTPLTPTAIFPDDGIGFCCDQVALYVESIDRFIWLLLGNAVPGGAGAAGVRLAVASPADIISSNGTAWTTWVFDRAFFGLPATAFFDYPSLTVGPNNLFMVFNVLCTSGCTSGLEVTRIPLGDILAGGTMGVQYTNSQQMAVAGSGHLSQNTGTVVSWAGHLDNSHMRVFSWPDLLSAPFWHDRQIKSWSLSRPSSTTPDGFDWLKRGPGSAIKGACGSENTLSFAWTAGGDSRFPQAHIEMVTINRSNPLVTQQVEIWNPDIAFDNAALATNLCTAEVGVSLEYGGGGYYEGHAVGILGDGVFYRTVSSDMGTTRFGDYVSIRQAPLANPSHFDAFGYGVKSPGGFGDVHYVSFGRPFSSCASVARGDRGSADSVGVTKPSVEDEASIDLTRDASGTGLAVSFTQAKPGLVRVGVYDIGGRLVRRLAGSYPQGRNTIRWDGTDERGGPVAPGIYVLRVTAGGSTYSTKGVLVR